MQAAKQPQTQCIFKRLDLSADRALRQAQFVRRQRKAAMARNRLEGVKQVQRWQAVFAHDRVYSKGAGADNACFGLINGVVVFHERVSRC